MTAAEVSRHLYAPRYALAAGVRDAEFAEIGGGFLTIDRSSDTEYPSTNPNRAEFVGVTRPTSRSEVQEITERFAAAGVRRWFFWLSPCPQAGEIRQWLLELGLRRFERPRYITLARSAEPVAAHRTALRVRFSGAPGATRLHGVPDRALRRLLRRLPGNDRPRRLRALPGLRRRPSRRRVRRLCRRRGRLPVPGRDEAVGPVARRSERPDRCARPCRSRPWLPDRHVADPEHPAAVARQPGPPGVSRVLRHGGLRVRPLR